MSHPGRYRSSLGPRLFGTDTEEKQSVYIYINTITYTYIIRDSSYRTATCYGLDGPGIKCRLGEVFCACPDRSWGLLNLLYNGYRVFSRALKRPELGVNHSRPSSAEVKERIETSLLLRAFVASPMASFTFTHVYNRLIKLFEGTSADLSRTK